MSQGLSAGILANKGMPIFLWYFQHERRGWAMSICVIFIDANHLIGPTLSGLIVDNLNLQFVFVIDFEICMHIILSGIFTRERPMLSTLRLNLTFLRVNFPALGFC